MANNPHLLQWRYNGQTTPFITLSTFLIQNGQVCVSIFTKDPFCHIKAYSDNTTPPGVVFSNKAAWSICTWYMGTKAPCHNVPDSNWAGHEAITDHNLEVVQPLTWNQNIRRSKKLECLAKQSRMLGSIKAKTHLAACVQRNPVRSNRANVSNVYCAHIVFFAGLRNVIRKKIEAGLIFLAYHTYSVFFCRWFMMPSVHTQHKKKTNANASCAPLDVIQPLCCALLHPQLGEVPAGKRCAERKAYKTKFRSECEKYSNWHETSRNAKKQSWRKILGGEKKIWAQNIYLFILKTEVVHRQPDRQTDR